MKFGSQGLISFIFGTECPEVDLEDLSNFLIQRHSSCNTIGLIIVLLVDGAVCDQQEAENSNQSDLHGYV